MSARSATLVVILCGAVLSGIADRAAADEMLGTTVASKRNRDFAVLLSTTSDRLRAGDNPICVEFQGVNNRIPTVDKVLAIEFRQLVGRMEGSPIRAEMSPQRANRYCGTVHLGRQYYNPANYYVFVRYTDTLGKKRVIRLHASIQE